MAVRAQIVTTGRERSTALGVLGAVRRGAVQSGFRVLETNGYEPHSGWLVLWGIGAPERAEWRDAHLATGQNALLLDMGYIERGRHYGHFRIAINEDHPWRWLDRTEPDPSRWDMLGRPLQQDANPDGPIILVGMGDKSRQMGPAFSSWEKSKVAELRERFPGKRIVYRPKPKSAPAALGLEVDTREPIGDVLIGASLVVCRHSNVAVDAAIAGVPFECDDGIAFWLQGKDYTPANRLDFLRRMAWWQWKGEETIDMWKFVLKVSK